MAIAPILCQRGAILIMTTSITVGTIGDGVVRTVPGLLAMAGAHGAGATILHIIMDIMVIRTIRGAIVTTIGMAARTTTTIIIIIMIMAGMVDIITAVTSVVVRLALATAATPRRALQIQ